MGQRGASDGRDSPVDRPTVLQVTVEPAPRRPGLRLPASGVRARVAVSLVGVIALVCAWLVIDGLGGARHDFVRHDLVRHDLARIATPYAGVAEPPLHVHGDGELDRPTQPYRFPLGCMSVTMTPRALAAALRARTGPCWRYGVFVTAVLRRVGGVWRLALEVTSPSCPRLALPPDVRAQIVACRR